MIALKINEIKDFMNKLLCSERFDHFLLQEASICTNITYHLEGSVHPDFYSKEDLTEQGLDGLSFIPFGLVRPQCFNLIKGKRTPSFFKFVFLLSPDNLAKTLAQTQSSFTENDISAVFLNLKYQNAELIVTTGISYRIFAADKTLDYEWDSLVKRFLKSNEISFEEL